MNYGESAPHLQKITVKILSQKTSSASCERNWSTFALIHTKQHNRMKQLKLQRNVFIHYNVRLRLRNMETVRGQAEQDPYCPINLNYIFTEPEDDPLLPWLEQREKDKDVANSEEENYPELVRETTKRYPPTIEEINDSSSATISLHESRNDTDSGNDNDGPQDGGIVRSTSETIVPSTYPQYSQSQHSCQDRGKSPIIQEDYEDDDGEEEDEEPQRMDSMKGQFSWSTGYLNVHTQPFYAEYPSQLPPFRPNSSTYSFHYPPQYEDGYEQFNNNDNDDDNNVEEPPRHSFWW